MSCIPNLPRSTNGAKGLQDKGMRDLAVPVSSCKEIKSNRHCGKQLLATVCGRGQTSDLPGATVHLVLSNICNNFLNLSGIQGKETFHSCTWWLSQEQLSFMCINFVCHLKHWPTFEDIILPSMVCIFQFYQSWILIPYINCVCVCVCASACVCMHFNKGDPCFLLCIVLILIL